MTDFGCLMSPAMVLGSLERRKTETRRMAWRPDGKPTIWQKARSGDRLWIREIWQAGGTDYGPTVGYFADGHRFYPKFTGPDEGAGPSFDYDAHPAEAWKRGYWLPDVENHGPWAPSIRMPRWASRLTYVDLQPRTEPIQAITREGAIAEGLHCLSKDDGRTWKYGIPDRDGIFGTDDFGWPWVEWSVDPIEAFIKLWTSLHGQAAWDNNPDVVVLPAGQVVNANIDAIG